LLIIPRYRHAITKERNRVLASETGGGILADEMGMGKSLSTLALITKTLDRAYDWVLEKTANPDNHTRQKPCRATLVVVPSASRRSIAFQISHTITKTVFSINQRVVQ
jgi:SWI/SNF-related matrix-associated actin-dependent regulator of chromatin subfamily A3